MPLYEYKIANVASQDDLNRMGADGWRFTAAQLRSGHWVFERERVPPAKPEPVKPIRRRKSAEAE